MKVNLKYFLMFVTGVAFVEASNANSNMLHVETPLGRINGYYKTSYKGRQYAAFESIPYAVPPIGELRFQPPVAITAYAKDIDALALPTACSQYNSIFRKITGVEDCLYLNIYTPAKNETESLPVIFWIPGGGFQYGSSSNYRAKFLMDRDIILVTLNYRVGVFGFLSTGDDVVPGNMGLKDQSLALRWVSENIKYFGGDPKRITLAGVSAGGASVHYHYLSPMSAGLFQNGIAFSGTATARWAYKMDSSETAKSFASALDCPTYNSTEMIKCLRSISADNMIKTTARLLSNLYFSYVQFPPVLEKSEINYFINDSPRNIIEKGNAYDVPMIAGVVSEEGLYITAGFALNETMIDYTEKHWETIAPYMLHLQNEIPATKYATFANMAKKHYFGNEPFSTDRNMVKKLTHMTGDDQIVSGVIRGAKLQAEVNKSPVWLYYYSYRASQSFSDSLSNTTEDLGVSHDDDIYIVLENDYIDPTRTQSDRAMLEDMLDFWYSVARDGVIPFLGGESWPAINVDSKQLQYMHIAGPGNFTVESSDNLGEFLFWDKLEHCY